MYYDGELINKAIENLKNADSYLKNADNYTGKNLVDDCQAISDSLNSKKNKISGLAITAEELGTFNKNVISSNNDKENDENYYKFDGEYENSNNQEDLNHVYIEYLKNEYNLTEEQAEEKFKEIERLIVSNKIDEIKKELNIELDSVLTNEELDKIINGDINLEDFFMEKSSSYRIKCQQLIISNQLILALNESEEFKKFNLTSYEDIEKAITKQQQTISDLENKRDNIQVPYDAKLFNKLLNKYPNPDLNNLLVYQNEETKEYWFAYYYGMGEDDIGNPEICFISESECLGNASELGIDINTIKENINQIKEIDTEIKKEREILSILKDTKETIDYQVTYYEKYMDPYIYNPDFVSKSAMEWREEGIISEICNITNYIYDYSKNCYLNQEFMDKYSDSLEYHEDPIHSYVKISNLENHPEIRDSLVLALINGSNIVFQEDGTFFDEDNGIYLYVDDTTYFESLGTIISGMDETHKAIFNYIHNTKGSEAAFEYINNNDVMNHINSEYLNLEKQKWEKYTIAEEGESQFLKSLRASLASIVIRPFEGLNSAIYSIRANSYGEKTYSGAMFMGSSYMRQLVGSTIDSDFWKFVYDTGMSMGDSTLLMLATMATGGGTSCLWSALIMGTPGYTEKYNEMIERGFTQEQAMEAGLVSAFIESLTEAYSTGHLLNLEGNLEKITANGLAKIESALGNSKYSTFAKGLYIAIAGMNNQAIANGEEEVCSEILNFIYDLEACEEGSVLNTRVAELMENDSLMTEDEAVFIALKEECGNIALSFAGGYLSGLFMGGIPSIKTAIQYNSTNSISGIQVMHETNPELAEVKLQEFNKSAQQLGLPSLSFDGEGNISIYDKGLDLGNDVHVQSAQESSDVSIADVNSRRIIGGSYDNIYNICKKYGITVDDFLYLTRTPQHKMTIEQKKLVYGIRMELTKDVTNNYGVVKPGTRMIKSIDQKTYESYYQDGMLASVSGCIALARDVVPLGGNAGEIVGRTGLMFEGSGFVDENNKAGRIFYQIEFYAPNQEINGGKVLTTRVSATTDAVTLSKVVSEKFNEKYPNYRYKGMPIDYVGDINAPYEANNSYLNERWTRNSLSQLDVLSAVSGIPKANIVTEEARFYNRPNNPDTGNGFTLNQSDSSSFGIPEFFVKGGRVNVNSGAIYMIADGNRVKVADIINGVICTIN